MKRLMLGVVTAALLLFSSVEPAWSQRPYGCGGICWQQNPGFGGRGMGFRNGIGPRALNGTCPFVAANPAAAAAANAVAPRGMGFRNGTGPRALNGTCPFVAANPAAAAAADAVAPSGMGLRNGTGPRALNGTCPLLAPSSKAAVPGAAAPATSK
jgi:hypothetical protein